MKLFILAFFLFSANLYSQEFYKLETPSGNSCLVFDKMGEPLAVCKLSKKGYCLYNPELGCHLGSGQKVRQVSSKKRSIDTTKWIKANFTPEVVGTVKRVNKCSVTVHNGGNNYVNYPKIAFSGKVKRGQHVSKRIEPAIFVKYVTPLVIAGQDLGGGVDSRGQDLGGGVDSRGQDLGGGVDSRSCEFAPAFTIYNFLKELDELMLMVADNKLNTL